MNTRSEKRRSFRVREWVHLDCQIISDREFHEGRARRNARRGGIDGLRSTLLDLDTRLSEQLYILRAASTTAASCIALLNEKITAIVEHMPQLQEQKGSLATREPQICELGADGIQFGTENEIAPGTHLALRFLFDETHRYVETFGTVRRPIPPPDPDDERHLHGVAVEFHGLESSQRELIIQHLFNREAENLRARRRQMEGEAG